MTIETHFVGDDIEFNVVFTVDGVEQLPVSPTVCIKQTNGTIILAETSSGVTVGGASGNSILFTATSVVEGTFKIYFRATFGNDKPTRFVTYRVIRRDGIQT